jgi:hypothetical protein
MKNTLSPILLSLQEALEAQGENVTRWSSGAVVIDDTDEAGTNILWIKQDEVDNFLDEDQLAELNDAGLLENDGEAMKLKAGRSSELAIGVRISEMKKKVRSTERDASQVQIMNRKVKDLERQLKAARDESAADLAMAGLINQMAEAFRIKPTGAPLKFDRTKASKKDALAGIPTLMLSDWHWGEVVDPDQIEGLNEFNLEIANRRADRVFSTTLQLLHQRQSGQTYDGMAVLLGGDMFSGNIHEELRITNDAPIHDCLLSLAEKLAQNLVVMAKEFPWLYVAGVVGNHGRIDRKPTAKFAVKDNYDWLLYNMVAMLVRGRLGDKCNVEFDISTALDLPFNLYSTRYLLTHGDQIGGGGGVGGFWPAMMKVAHRKQQRAVKSGAGGFDYMVCGHFHKYGNVANVIVNGSLKGYDEWVYKMNFEWERAQQALWVTHPEYGITGHLPVYGDPLEPETNRIITPVTNAAGLRKVRR